MARHTLLLLFFLFGCGSQSADDPGREAQPLPAARAVEEAPEFAEFEAAARASTNRLQLDLKQELAAAIKDGGSASAVEVCSQRAAEMTAEVSQQTGLDVRRVSLRNRNPNNEATPVEASVLAMMAARTDLADTMIIRDGAPLYMRAIRINTPACLSCHGKEEDLDPEVLDQLNELYVDDRATGFSEGDLRGAFAVRPILQ